MDKYSVLRFVALLAGVVGYFGFNIGEELQSALADILFGAYIVYMAWKNNYLSKRGAKQKEVLDKNGLS